MSNEVEKKNMEKPKFSCANFSIHQFHENQTT